MDVDERMELELVAQSRVGASPAFEELMRRHVKEVFRLCRRYARNDPEAEDLVQDTFVLCYRGLPALQSGVRFRSWLFRIAVNVCQSALRKRYREERKLAKLRWERGEQEEPAPDPASADLKEVVRRKIEMLPERQREVLQLHLNPEMSYRDIAGALGISYEDVKTNLCLARKRLREELRSFLQE
jgi:RNA polymerase sigma-70 factor (ECF subfamily)